MLTITRDFDYPIIKARIEASSLESGIYVGCDAKVYGQTTRFNTVIVIHFDSCRGSTFFAQTAKVPRAMSLHEKLWKEVELAGHAASEIADVVGERPFNVHLDLSANPMHRSSQIVRAAQAYIQGLGFNPVVKPDAFAASHVADHVVRGKSNWNN